MIFLCFLLTGLIYSYIGIMGAFVIKDILLPSKPDTIMDYFLHDKLATISLQLIYSMHLLTVMPSINKIMRLRINAIFQLNKYILNLAIVATEFILVFFRKWIPLQFIVDLNGSLFTFFLNFFFPSLLYIAHLKITQK